MSEGARELVVMHQHWLQDPVTKTLLRAIDQQEQKYTEFLCTIAVDDSVSDAKVRRTAVQLQTIKQLKQTVYATEVLIAKSGQ